MGGFISIGPLNYTKSEFSTRCIELGWQLIEISEHDLSLLKLKQEDKSGFMILQSVYGKMLVGIEPSGNPQGESITIMGAGLCTREMEEAFMREIAKSGICEK